MPDNDLQKLSAAYRLPASDMDFLLSDSMQGVRFLLEFAKAEEQLRHWGIQLRHSEIQFESPIGPILNCSINRQSPIINHQWTPLTSGAFDAAVRPAARTPPVPR